MLPRKVRFKVWMALIGFCSWFAFVYFIISFRLKSDDLELMEREVYEELKMKKQVEQFIKKQKEDEKVLKMSQAAKAEPTQGE